MQPTPSSSIRRWAPIAVALWTVGSVVALPGATPSRPTVRQVDSVAAPERDHFLFVGVDLYVVQDNQLVQVQAFDGDQARITKDNGDVATIERTQGFKWRMNPKISPLAASITKLKAEPVYSPAQDPNRNWASQQMGLMDYYADQTTKAENDLSPSLGVALALAQSAPKSGATFVPNLNKFETKLAQIDQMVDATAAAQVTPTKEEVIKANAQGEDAPGTFDALELTFQVSAPEPIADAYVVAITRLRTREGFLDINFQRAIGAVGPSPRKVTISQAGLPKGFEHLETKLHLFNHGEEIATNLSERRVGLTADEARDYVMLDYVSRNRGATVPASPVWALAPEALRSAPQARLYDFSAEVDIDAAGKLVAVRAPGDQIMPDQVRTVVEQFSYVPALDQGVPVASTIRVNPADYFK